MRHVGILGHSVEGAALCLRALCQRAFEELGPHRHPDVTLDVIEMARSMAAHESGDHEAVRAILAESVTRLARAGAEFFVCPDNTAHMALEAEGPAFELPGLHIVEVVADEAARRGIRRAGILGTKYTMSGPLYPRALGARGIAFEVPEEAERRVVDDIIFVELVNGVFTRASRERYVEIIAGMRDRGCDAALLVCTEIPLLVTPEDSPLPTLDSTRLLAAAAYEVAVGRRPLPVWRGGPLGA
jgi:aspartate racemase